MTGLCTRLYLGYRWSYMHHRFFRLFVYSGFIRRLTWGLFEVMEMVKIQ